MNNEYVYHYTTAEIAYKFILQDKRIRFSDMHNANDPCEWNNNLFSISNAERKAIVHKKFWEYQHEFGDLLKNGLKFFCCTLETDEVKGYNHPRMWAQYADNSKGIILKFNKEKLVNAINEALIDLDSIIGYKEIDYILEHRPNAIYFTKEQLETQEMSYLVYETLKNNSDFLFQKNKDWKDETEFRFLIKSEKDVYVNIENCLEEIICGLKIESNDKRLIELVVDKAFSIKPEVNILTYCNGSLSVEKPDTVYCGEVLL